LHGEVVVRALPGLKLWRMTGFAAVTTDETLFGDSEICTRCEVEETKAQ